MRVLVTGATGFLGQATVAKLLQQGHSVRAIGRRTDQLAQLRGHGAEVILADLRDAVAMNSACREIDAVLHLGARSAPWGPAADFYADNVTGTAHVLAGCQQHRVRRVVYVSSPSVVFDGRDHVRLNEAAPFPRRLMSVYSETKKRAEELVNQAGPLGLETVILRPKAIFGPGDTTLLPRIVEAARAGRLPRIGDGLNRVDLTYVDNVVDALLLSLTSRAAVGQTYFVTNGESPLLWDVIATVLQRNGITKPLRPVPYRVVYAIAGGLELAAQLTGREPTLTRYTAAILARTQTYDITAAQRDLGYVPRVSLAEGIEHTLAATSFGRMTQQ